MALTIALQRLLDAGWEHTNNVYTWTTERGSRLVFRVDPGRAWLTLHQGPRQVLAYEIQFDQERLDDLVSALMQHTDELASIQQPGFSEAIVPIANDIVVETTEGYLVRPVIGEHGFTWDPIGPKKT